MRRSVTFIVSLLLAACGSDEKPKPKTSDFKSSTYQAAKPDTEPVTPGVTFVDVTEQAGIDFRHVHGARGDKWLPETMGSGVGLIDFDSDGDSDLLFVQSRPWEGDAPTMRLYRNDGAWKFADVTKEAGLEIPCYGMGVSIADYDADGDSDFYLTCLHRNRLFRNEGGRFVEVENGPSGGNWLEGNERKFSWSTGAVWFDVDGDEDLDLFVINYVKWTPERDVFQTVEGEEKDYTRPQLYEGEQPRLYRQFQDGSLRDVTAGSGLEGARSADRKSIVPGKSLAVCVDDFNQDGRPDLFVANDTVQNFLFLNRGGAKFDEIGIAAGVGYDDTGHARAAMGIDSFDFANKGDISILISNFSEEPVSFFTVAGKKGRNVLFRDDAARARIGQPTLLPLSFGLILRDMDLDGWCDLVIANGHIMPTVNKLKAELQYRQSPQYFRNVAGERMVDVSVDAGRPFQDRFVGRGLAAGDLDGDGDLDLVFTANNGRPRVLRNDLATKNNFLRIRLRQPKSKNRDALGAAVLAETATGVQRRIVRTGGSYLSQGEFTVTFGLGELLGAAVTVIWPDGERQILGPMKAGSHTIER
ncbi:MAG: FG-GAP-like repeat-containing protein [Planctomycetota bacterium]|jgi:hypothetical protein